MTVSLPYIALRRQSTLPSPRLTQHHQTEPRRIGTPAEQSTAERIIAAPPRSTGATRRRGVFSLHPASTTAESAGEEDGGVGWRGRRRSRLERRRRSRLERKTAESAGEEDGGVGWRGRRRSQWKGDCGVGGHNGAAAATTEETETRVVRGSLGRRPVVAAGRSAPSATRPDRRTSRMYPPTPEGLMHVPTNSRGSHACAHQLQRVSRMCPPTPQRHVHVPTNSRGSHACAHQLQRVSRMCPPSRQHRKRDIPGR